MPSNIAATVSDPEPSAITSPSLQERKQQLVRSAIWDAAMDLFAEKGYEETTVDDIAQSAGVSRRSFFRYFASKSDLMGYGIAGYGTFLSEAIESCPADYPLAKVFRQTVFEVARKCAGQPRTRKIIEIATRHPAAREAQFARTAGLQERIEEAFALRSGKREQDIIPRVAAGLILSVLSVVFRVWAEQDQADISATVETVLAAVGPIACIGKGRLRNRASGKVSFD